jgi:hypothetical protein
VVQQPVGDVFSPNRMYGFTACRASQPRSPVRLRGNLRSDDRGPSCTTRRNMNIFSTDDPGIDRISRGYRGDTTGPEDAGKGSY